MANHVYIPTSSAEHWAQCLAEPGKHWRTGFSARTLAYSWHEALGFPTEVQAALSAAEPFAGIEMLLAIPEHQVPLPGGSRPSQNDIWILARAKNALVSIAVEGKIAEPFGPTVAEWLADGSPGKKVRLEFLASILGLQVPVPGHVRYQLLHRAASAVIEAQRFCASHAVMLVHSFSQGRQWFADYAAFAALFGVDVEANRVASIQQSGPIQLHLCWVCGNEQYLAK